MDILGFVGKFHQKLVLGVIFVLNATFLSFGQIPANYYDAALGKSGRQLQEALSHIIDNQTVLFYGSDNPGGLWHAFRTTDVRADGTVWDIYSNCVFIPWEDGHITSSGECNGGTQQEHTFCQSWMNYASTPLYSDIFHIYPVDAWVNGRRSNYPYGEVPDNADWITRVFQNGAKLGYNNYTSEDYESYCNTVYEPVDEYKGDIARGFFYIATRYMFEDSAFSESYGMTCRSQLRPWALSMMKKWHHQDPVSQKEIDRNDNIYNLFQHNRNPYIDYPELVDLVFGDDSSHTTFQWKIPQSPENFQVVPDSTGQLYAILSWKNPESFLDGQNIDTLYDIIIYRNEQEVHRIHQSVPGQQQTWVDYAVPNARNYEYRICAETTAGAGLSSRAHSYIGQSCPVTVELFDEQYDGWQGEARLEFHNAEDELLSFLRLACGSDWENTFELPLPAETINCVWVPGTKDEENSFIIVDFQSDTLYSTTCNWVYDSTSSENYLHSDVQYLSGIFYSFDNGHCPLETLSCRVYDTLTVLARPDELPYSYEPGGFVFTADMLSNPSVTYLKRHAGLCDSIITVNFLVSTEYSNIDTDFIIDIQPNPTEGQFEVVVSGDYQECHKTQVYDVSSHLLFETILQCGTNFLDLSSYPSGVYILKIKQGNHTIIRKLIKK